MSNNNLKIYESPDSYISRLCNENEILIFIKSQLNIQIENIFNLLNKSFTIINLHNIGDEGKILYKELIHLTKNNCSPWIFIHRQYKNYNQIINSYYDGQIKDWIKNNFIEYDYDLIIIGLNQGGLSAAEAAGIYQKNVLVCDNLSQDDIFVTEECLKYVFNQIQPNDDAEVTWNTTSSFIKQYLAQTKKSYIARLKSIGVDYYPGRISFINEHTILLKRKNKRMSAQNILLALEKPVYYPKIREDIKSKFTTIDNLFISQKLPGKILIYGNSITALIYSAVLNFLKIPLTLLYPEIFLKHFDQEIVGIIFNDLINAGVKVENGIIRDISEPLNGWRTVHAKLNVTGEDLDTKFKEKFNTVLYAFEKKFDESQLNLSNIGVEVHPKSSFILSNNKNQTSVSNIYAIGGTVHGRSNNGCMASQAAQLLMDRLYGHQSNLMNYENIPVVLRGVRQYGYVGLSEESAVNIHGADNITIYKSHYIPLENTFEAMSLIPPHSYQQFIKMICLKNESNERVLGIHLVGNYTAEFMYGCSLALRKLVTIQDFRKTFRIEFSNVNFVTKYF